MMKLNKLRLAAAAALCGAALSAQAASVQFNAWTFPTGSTVNTNIINHTSVNAGGFTGTVSFDAGDLPFTASINPFESYCVEINESFSGFPSVLMTGYRVVTGTTYGHWAGANGTINTSAATALRLGRLMSYVNSTTGAVDTAAESTAMQLAIWNVIYDTDSNNTTAGFNSVANGSFASTSSSFTTIADALLDSSRTYVNKYEVFVLTKSGSQDFVLLRETPGGGTTGNGVPEPGSVALSLAALGALAFVRRRRASSIRG